MSDDENVDGLGRVWSKEKFAEHVKLMRRVAIAACVALIVELGLYVWLLDDSTGIPGALVFPVHVIATWLIIWAICCVVEYFQARRIVSLVAQYNSDK